MSPRRCSLVSGFLILAMLGLVPRAHGVSAELRLTSDGNGGLFGYFIHPVGDFDGDGFVDLGVAAFQEGPGKLYLYRGGPSFDGTADIVIDGHPGDGYFGYDFSAGSDLNGDGYRDLIVGAPLSGLAYIYFGGPGADLVADATLAGPGGSYLGYAAAGLGDFDGDGFDDFAVGLPEYNGLTGEVWVYRGGPGFDLVPDLVLTGEAHNDEFGWHVIPAGDVNGDGYRDLMTQSHVNDAGGWDAGRAYVFFGGPSADGVPDLVMTGEAPGDALGFSIAAPGDLNGDGFDDVAAGSYQKVVGGTDAGRAYVCFGGPAPDGVPDVVFTGGPSDWLGQSMTGVSDLNGDGCAELLVGAPQNGGSFEGRLDLFLGGPGMDNVADLGLPGEDPLDYFGVGATCETDFDGDGFAELVAGSTNHGGVGRIYVYDLFAGPGETPRGSPVIVTPRDGGSGASPVTVTFDEVTRAGRTGLTIGGGCPPPASYRHGVGARCYDLTTSATFGPGAEVEVAYEPGDFVAEANVRMFHDDGSGWSDVTTGRNIAAHTVRGRVTSFSTFALFEPTNTVAPGAPPSCIDLAHPCVTVPVEMSRGTSDGIRGFSVDIQLSAGLSLCGSIAEGGYLPAVGGTHFEAMSNGAGSYTVDAAILGVPCGATAPTGTLFTIPVTGSGSTTGTITVTAVTLRDCLNGSIAATPGAPITLTIDTVPPAAATGLVAAQRRTGNDSDGTTKIDLAWTSPGDAATARLYRAPWGGYPEYDDAGYLAAPAAPSWPPVAPWVLAAILPGLATGYADEPPSRDLWHYVVFVTDACGNVSPVSNRTGGTLNYHLGDVTNGAPPAADNLVGTIDVSLLGAHYGASLAPGDPFNYLDVGPTTDYSVNARPTTDNRIQFEDMMMFAMNFGQVSAPVAAGDDVGGEDRLHLETRSAGAGLEAVLVLESAHLQGLSVDLAWDPAVVRPAEVVAGSLLERQSAGAALFSSRPGNVDLALLGRGRRIEGTGEAAVVRFDVVGAGDPAVRLARAEGRDIANRLVPLDAAPPGSSVAGFHLGAAYPNPFRSELAIPVEFPRSESVRLDVFDIGGRRVRTLIDGLIEPGASVIDWDGRDGAGRPLPSGFYLLRLDGAGRQAVLRVFKAE